MIKHRILVLGASGMLGNAVFRYFAQNSTHDVVGSIRSERTKQRLPDHIQRFAIIGGSVDDPDALIRLLDEAEPTLVINCVGLIKQVDDGKNPLTAIPINSILPHRLAKLCSLVGSRLVHLSTDCVFSGNKGMYVETDTPDASDVYGRTKLLGEVDYPNAITLRTSIIGHELDGANSLIGWFLAQTEPVKGFNKAVFSGIPTVEIARIISDCVIPNPELRGLYHLSAEPIDKATLLRLVAKAYGKDIEIHDDDRLVIDRSLDSTRFRKATGFRPLAWPDLIKAMHQFS